jgi:hypothetical protein
MKLALLIFLGYSTVAGAVCVEGHIPIQKEYSQSVFVLTVDVVSSQVLPDSKDKYFLSGTNYTLRPVEILKGHPSATVTVFSENSSILGCLSRGHAHPA